MVACLRLTGIMEVVHVLVELGSVPLRGNAQLIPVVRLPETEEMVRCNVSGFKSGTSKSKLNAKN